MKKEMKIRIVKKGETALMPLNSAGYQWVRMESTENGIVLSVGPNRGFGVFIDESKLREFMAEFEKGMAK
jgi:hypothetical protein